MVFKSLGTQWRTGMNGATGLDYNAIEPVLKFKQIKRQEWPSMFDSIRIMEDEALTVMSEE